jgi:hypothetical protein
VPARKEQFANYMIQSAEDEEKYATLLGYQDYSENNTKKESEKPKSI